MASTEAAFSTKTRLTVRQRSGGICERCGVSPAVQMHHRTPRGSGGSSDTSLDCPCNALHLCVKCHGTVESSRTYAKSRGWLVLRNLTTYATPVLYRGRWTFLNCDGSTSRTERPT